MKKFAKICTFLILILCGVVFAACGNTSSTPILSSSENNVELIIGTDESKSFDVTLSNYGNGSDSVRVESYENKKIIELSTQKIGVGKTRVTLKPLYPGNATIKVSSITHNAKPIEISVKVILPVGDIEFNKDLENSIYVIKGESVDFENLDLINYLPISTGDSNLDGVKTNQIGVTYTLENVLTTDGVQLENGKLVVSSDCALSEIEVRATSIYNAEISKTFKVKILNPISSTVYIDGNKVFENGNLVNGSGNSYAFELYPRESDITVSQKDVLLFVKAGSEAEVIKVEKIFDESKYSVELKSLTYEDGVFKYTYTISALNAGYLENISFKISYKDYTYGENEKDYYVESGNLSVATYNLPNSVLVNGNSSTDSGLDILVFENIATISKGTLLEFTLSPSHLAPEYETIRLWAASYANCPISFYKLNSTRTSYELVYGYPRDAKDGSQFVCTGIDQNGNAYFDMPIGTKLYVVKNQMFDKVDNTNATLFASSLNFYNLGLERSKLQLNVKVNPGASSVDRAEYDGTNFTIINSNIIVTEFIDSVELYLAIAPQNFDIGTSSIVKLKNSNIADVSELKVISKDDNYVYVKFTLTPKKLGATKLTVYLCDGFEKEFELKVISTLDNIDITVSDETESIVDYKETLTGKINEADANSVTVQKLAFKSGTSIQLAKTAYPISAEYIVEYSFYDLATTKTISELSIKEIFEDASFNTTSNILNADTLSNYSIIQAKTSQSEGKTLIKVDVKGRLATGEGYEEEASYTFYFLIEIYKGVENFDISSNVHEIYSYDTLGDRNADKSFAEFTVTLLSKFGTPTYLNSLQLYYGVGAESPIEFNEAGRAVVKYNDKDVLVLTRSLSGNVWTYRVQALTADIQNYVFVLKLVEVDESKIFGGVVRVIVKEAVEITDIEIVNVDLENGIYLENNTLNEEEEGPTFEIKYNIYTKDGSEPLNSGLEFELSSNLSMLGVKIDAQGKITVPAGVGGNGRILIYPSSNYFASSNGMKDGEKPFIEIPISIANGESEETAIRIDSQEKIKYLKQNPTKHYLLVGDFSISETISEFSGGLYGLQNGKTSTLTLTSTMFEKLTGIVKNINIIGEINAQNANLGAICYENYGKIENVNASGLKISNTEAGSHTGALVGVNYGEIVGGEIVATVKGVNVGGVAGLNGTKTENEITFTGKIENVTFAGNITASGNAGGIVAENNGEISKCKVEKWSNNQSAFIAATSSGYVGSIAGVSSGKISQTYAYSYNDTMYDITATANVVIGGLVGQVSGGTITECMTNFSLEGTQIGALVGKITSGSVNNSYTLSKVSSSSASALATDGADKISDSYSRAFYVNSGVNKYLTQTGETNVYCAGDYTSLDNFNLALQNNLSKTSELWDTDLSTNNRINQGAAYLVNANPPKAVSSIEININEAGKTKYLYTKEDGKTNIVLYYYQLLEELTDSVAKAELARLNSISLENLFGENNNLLFNVISSTSISFVGNNIKILGVGKTEVKVTSKYATTTCQEETITFYVIYPIQDFNLYRGSSALNPSTIVKDGDVDQVGMSKTETYSSKVKSTVLLNGQNYSIFTNLFAIGFEIRANNSAPSVLGGISSIYDKSNNEGTFDDNFTFVSEGTYTITPKNYTFVTDEEEKFSINSILVLQNNGIGTYLGNISEFADFDVINKLISQNFKKNYEIKVVRGASRIQTTLTDSELSPSNVLNFDVVAISDKKQENLIIDIYEGDEKVGSSEAAVEKAIFDVNVSRVNSVENNHYFNVYISVKSDVRKTISKTRQFAIKIYDEDKKVVSVLNLTLIPQEVVSISNSHYAANNEVESGFSINTTPTSVLRPGKNGLLAINLYPEYAAYSKIEIESAIINDNYYVLFEQMVAREQNNYQNASGIIGYSSERDTNKLTIYYSNQLANDGGMVYVRTKITESVPDGVYFPITIKVYPADETKEIKTSTFVLASETINKAQITVDGKKDAVVSRGNSIEFEISVNEDQELTDIRVLNHDKNSDDNCDYINLIYNRTEYEISNGKKIYKGIINVGLNAELNGDGVVKIQTIMRKTINGKLEEEYDSITLSIVDFTIDGMYIEGNQEDDNVFVAPIQLRQDITFGFKLSKTPTYNSSKPVEKEAVERIESNKAMFLKNIALDVEYNQYLYAINKDLVTFKTDEVTDGYSKDIANAENKANIAYSLYYKNTNSKYFDENGVKNSNNYFDIIIDKDASDKPLSSRTFAINGLRTGTIPMQIKIAYTLPSDHNVTNYFTYDFVIKVQTYEDEDTPIAITNEEEFIRYMNATTTESGEPANYILMNDLYLTDFTPIANTEMIASLDGNNKIITIRNFNISSMLNNNANQTLNLALFQTVGENTTLKNLTINLYELEDIIIDEEKVSNVNVAGLFIDNYGIIYNCEVTALNLWKAYNNEVLASKGISTIEQEDLNKSYKPATYSDGFGIRVYFSAENIGKLKKDSTVVQIAGLGIKNFAAGRITNSRVGNTTFTKVFMTSVANNQSQDYVITAEHLTLLGQADIAGVVLSNEGVIASSFFSNGYITNLAVSGTASKTAGFAIYNAYGGIITGSYVKSFKKASELNGKFYTDGGIYSEGISAGFVYENSSEITDCYANLLLGGSLSGRLVSGFVYSNTNSGNIERCYSAATITGKLTTRMPFSGNNAKGDSMQLGKLTNCYYFVTNYDSETLLEEKYSTGAYAILASLVERDLLYGFAYTSDSKSLEGSSIDGVWRYTNGEINLSSANSVAISVRYLIENYNGVEGSRRFPYVNEYKYGSKNNPIIIRTADEFNRAFGQETNLKENAYYAISQFYNKNDGTVFGNYRLVSHIDFNNVVNIASTKIASSLMALTGKSNIGGLFDGNGLTISNIEIALSEQENVGLFGQVINGAVFKNANLTVKQVNAGNGVNVGGVAGLVSSSSLINISLEATNLKGENRSEITGKNVIGGIAGLVQGDCKLSNLSSSISVISNYRGENEYKRGQIDCSNLSYAGGIAGIIDIYKTAGESSVSVDYAQVNKLNVSGESIIIEAYYVGGVIGYLGKSTKASDLRFEISGDSNFEQHISSTGNTAGGIVGVNFGDLSEIRIEHEDDVQKQIEDSVAGYYKNSSAKYGHTNLFYDVETTNDVNIKYVGGLVGQMLAGNLINSYSKVDVSLPTADYAGGLIGYNKSNGIFDQVYALGDVDGKIAGGFIGKNEGTTKLSHAVAINVYSKQNSNLLEALEKVLSSNSFDLTKTNKLFDEDGNLILTTEFGELDTKYIFNKTTNENALSISEIKPFAQYSTKTDIISYKEANPFDDKLNISIVKLPNEYLLYDGNTLTDWNNNKDSNKSYEKYFDFDDKHSLYIKDNRIYKKYDSINNVLSEEITSESFKEVVLDILKINDEYRIYNGGNLLPWNNSSVKEYSKSFVAKNKDTLYLSDGKLYNTFNEETKKLSGEINDFSIINPLAINIIKINNEFYIRFGVNLEQKWDNIDDIDMFECKYERNNISLKLYVQDGRLYKTYNTSTKKLSDEITNFTPTYYLQSIEFSNEGKIVLTAVGEQLDVYGNIVSLNVDKIGCIAGEGVNNLKIGEEVYANKSFTINNVKLILSGSDTTKVEKLIISLDDYNGVAQHGTLLNRMFLAAANAWDVSMWAKDDDDMLPYLIFGIVSKVLYIEKPKDFERLWKYSGEGYVVIIGDDPATSFNPYEYKSGDASTYGEFTAAELTGLSVKGNNLYFNLSSIQETFVPTDFKGTIYGEYTGKNYYIGGLTEKSLFKSISGAVVRNIAFGYESENSYIHNSALMAEYIENNALVTNISVKNVTLNIDATANGNYGALVNSVSGVSEISAFTIDNVEFKLNNKVESSSINVGIFAGQLENCDKLSAITIKNSQIAVEGAAYTSASVGLIAGNITGSNSTIKNDVATESNEIAINATSVSGGELYVGGHIGKAENTIVVEGRTTSYDAIKALTIDFTSVNEGKVFAGLMFGGTQELAVESGAKIIGQIKNGNNAVTAYIGGLAGQAKGTINGVSVDGKDGNLINVNVKSIKDFYSSIGGIVGYVSGGSLTITGTNNVNGNISVKNNSEFAVAVGGLVGSIGADLEINNSSNIVVGSSNSEENNTIKVESEKIALGGIVGLIDQNAATISGTIHVWSIIEAHGKDMCVGGIVGKVDNLNNSNNKIVTIESDNATNLTFNGDIKAFATQTGATLNIGGIVGSITGIDSNNKNNLSKINKVGFKNGSIYVESESTSDIKTMNVGGLVGFMSHTLLEGGLVSGNIEINKISITAANIGGVVGQITGGTSSVKVCVNGTKSWGNIKLADDMTIASLYIGGVVGIAPTGTYWQFGSNSTLTSIYNKNLATGNFADNVRALVGSAPAVASSEVASSKNGETNLPIKLTNKYSHMFNLSIDDTSYGKNSTFESIKSDFNINENKDLFGDALVEGSKLNPKVITSDTTFGENGKNDAKDMQYYIANRDIGLSGVTIYANAHLIGNGKVWSTTTKGKDSSPILTNGGYISGFKFETSSKYTLTKNDILEETAPSGVANINNGIIYANTVVVYGNDGSFDKSAQKYSIYAGVAGENNGLIADTGAILYVKNALAGFVANNQGSIINSYVNGVVHNGAMYSFNGSESNSSKILNCYTSIRQGGVIDTSTGANPIFNGGTLKDNFYDRNGTEIEAAQSGVTMSTINDDAESFLSSINTLNRFAQSAGVNFGYPTLSNGAYAKFDYLKVSTGEGTNVSVLQIPNVGKLEQIKNNTAIKYVQILTNLDYTNSGVDLHAQINSITYFEGNGFAINNIPGNTSENTSSGFFGEIIDDESTDYKDTTSKKTYLESDKDNYAGDYYYLTKEYSQENWGNNFKDETAKLEVSISATKSSKKEWWQWYAREFVDYVVNIKLNNKLFVENYQQSIQTTNKWGTLGAQAHNIYITFEDQQVDSDGIEYTIKYEISIEILLSDGSGSINYGGKGGVLCSIYYITETHYETAPSRVVRNAEFNYKNKVTVGSNSSNNVGAVIDNANNVSLINVRSSGATVVGNTSVGGLVGYMNGGAIWNCYNFNDVQINNPISSKCAAGGLVGYAESVNFGYNESNKNGNYGNISISGSGYAGGVIGNSVNCRINYAYNIGNVSSNTFAGGLIGYYSMAYAGANNETLCSHLYNYGIVTSGNCAGGVIGYGYLWNDANEDLQYLFNFGTVKADAGENSNIDIFTGGIVGAIKVVSTNTISIKYSGNEGSVSGIGKRWVGVGGIVGAHIYSFDEVGGSKNTAKNGGSVSDCYNSGNLLCANLNSNDGYVGGIAGGNVTTIENCSMTGKITIRDDETFGWIMGSAWGGATINNCYAEPSTVVVEEKTTVAGTRTIRTERFYLDYQFGIYVHFYGSRRNDGAYYGEFNNGTREYKFKLVLPFCGNLIETYNGSNNIIQLNTNLKVTDVVISYQSTLSSGEGALTGYIHENNKNGFISINTGIYGISGVNTIWELYRDDGDIPSVSDVGLTAATVSSNIATKDSLKDEAHALDWTSISATSPKTEDAEITTAEELAYIAAHIEGYKATNIKLMNDIDLTGYIWTPIGNYRNGIGLKETIKANNESGWKLRTGSTTWSDLTLNTDYGTLKLCRYNDTGGYNNYEMYINDRLVINQSETSQQSPEREETFTYGGYNWQVLMNGKDWTINIFELSLVGTSFEGSFDGNGYTITGMAAFSECFGGLFGNIHHSSNRTYMAEFKNVRILNSVVQSRDWAGSIAGQIAAGSDNAVLIYNNIIDCKVYGQGNRVGSIVGRLGNTGNGYKAVIALNAVKSNVDNYASSDSGAVEQVDTPPKITYTYNHQEYRKWAGIFGALAWRTDLFAFNTIKIENAIYKNANLDAESFIKFDDEIFISNIGGQLSFQTTEKVVYDPSDGLSDPKEGNKRWTKREITFKIESVNKYTSNISDYVGNDFYYSYNGSNSSSDIIRYDNNLKEFFAQYEFILKVFDQEHNIFDLKYAKNTSYSFKNDIKLHLLTRGGPIIGYKLNNSETLTEDTLRYADIKNYVQDGVVTLEIVRSASISTIEFYIGSNENPAKIYMYEFDESGNIVFTDYNETSNPTDLYVPDGRSGYWVDQNGKKFTKENIKEGMGSFALYWIDDESSSGTPKYSLSDYFYTITFDLNDGSGNFEDCYILKGDEYELPNGPTPPSGKVFVGWSDGSTTYDAGAIITISSDTELTAQYVDKTYTISFNAGEGSGEMSATTQTSTNYTLPECSFTAPNGKVFAGWLINNAAKSDGSYYQPGEQIALVNDITLKADWKEIEHTISIYIPVDKKPTIKNSEETSKTIGGVEYTVSISDNYIIISYAYALETDTSSDNYNKSKAKELLKDSTTINSLLGLVQVDGKSSVSLTSFENYVVLGGINGKSDAVLGVNVGDSVKNIPSGKVGNAKVGIYGTIEIRSSESTSESTLDESSYFRTISYIFNGNTIDTQTFSKEYEIQENDIPTELSKQGYNFVGYGEDGKATRAEVATDLNKNATYQVNFELIKYTVTYNGNGATDGSVGEGTYSIEDAHVVAANGFKNPGYKFIGWNTMPDGLGTSFSVGESIGYDTFATPNNITLYAQWEEITLTIVFEPGEQGSGTNPETKYLHYGESITLPANPYDCSWYYEFTGWKCNGKNYTAGETFDFVDSLTKDATYTFTAQWKERELTIKFNNAGTMDDKKFTYPDKGGNYTLPECKARKGFSFAGWSFNYVYEDGGNYYSITKVANAGEVIGLANMFANLSDGTISYVYEITLTATWTAKYNYQIVINPNSDAFSGLALASYNPITSNYSSEALEAGTTISKPGFVVTSGDYELIGYAYSLGATSVDLGLDATINFATFFTEKTDGVPTCAKNVTYDEATKTFTLTLYAVWGIKSAE